MLASKAANINMDPTGKMKTERRRSIRRGMEAEEMRKWIPSPGSVERVPFSVASRLRQGMLGKACRQKG